MQLSMSTKTIDRSRRFRPQRAAAQINQSDDRLAAGEAELPLPDRWRQLVLALLLIGLAARLVRYLLCFPLWEDECFLVYNLIDRSYAELLKPLDYHQVCPVMFLWIEATAVRLFGFNEYALRLVPVLISIASLFLFRHVAERLLRGWALVLAVGWFAVSYPMIRYAAEAKPYGSDLFLALVQIALIVEWRRRPQQSAWLWGLVALAPLAVSLSFPTVFLAGGVSLFILFGLLKERSSARVWAPWILYNLAIGGTFLLVYMATMQTQNTAELPYMQQFWHDEFPPISQPLSLPWWLLKVHASDLLAFPFGGRNFASLLTLICCVSAVAFLVRKRAWSLLALGLVPLALQFCAAALHRYPYGGHSKLTMYLGTMICLFCGIGVTALLARLAARRAPNNAGVKLITAGLMLVALGSMARDFWRPGKTHSDIRARDFARWFWINAEYNQEVACLKTDLNLEFAPKIYQDLNWTAMYLCNQRIYSPRRAKKQPLRLDLVTKDHPLQCVEYRVPDLEPKDDPARERWLNEMCRRYDLVGRETIPFVRYNKRETKVMSVDRLELYNFAPKGTGPGAGRHAALRDGTRIR